jgi:hypothetical protein
MMIGAATLLLALGATAQIPDWVQKKKPQGSFIANLQSKLKQTTTGRRLDGHSIMSEECAAACPGVTDMIKAMSERRLTEGRRLDGHDEMMKLCPHWDAVECASGEKACQDGEPDEGSEEMMSMIGCMCACPKIADIGEDMSKVCDDKSGTVGCMNSESKCDALTKDMDEVEIDLSCEYLDKKCDDKQEKMVECAGDDTMEAWAKHDCSDKIDDNAAECCPLGKELVTCIGQECMQLSMAVDMRKAEKGDKYAVESIQSSKKSRDACPDAGIPSPQAVAATASSGTTSGTSSGSTDFAARGQTVSILALAAMMSVSMMA